MFLAERYLQKISLPKKNSHKGQNGRLLIIGGSHLFHSASLWALKVASRIVDLVHYSSVPENNHLVQKLKEEFRDGIVVPREEVESYVQEDDCILIGPGMLRVEEKEHLSFSQTQTEKLAKKELKEILKIKDEGWQTYYLTQYLLTKYPQKKWVIDAGALQMLELSWIPQGAILTPHRGEFARLKAKIKDQKLKMVLEKREKEEQVRVFAQKYHCTILLKGEKDIVAGEGKKEVITGGNAGMTKGGTGDVLAGLLAAFYCKNEAFVSAVCASFFNKKAAEDLYQEVGFWFNASDLADQIPKTMKKILLGQRG